MFRPRKIWQPWTRASFRSFIISADTFVDKTLATVPHIVTIRIYLTILPKKEKHQKYFYINI
jgi:hypothetical protein